MKAQRRDSLSEAVPKPRPCENRREQISRSASFQPLLCSARGWRPGNLSNWAFRQASDLTVWELARRTQHTHRRSLAPQTARSPGLARSACGALESHPGAAPAPHPSMRFRPTNSGQKPVAPTWDWRGLEQGLVGAGTEVSFVGFQLPEPPRVCELSCSVVSDSFATPQTVARQAPLSTGFPRQE